MFTFFWGERGFLLILTSQTTLTHMEYDNEDIDDDDYRWIGNDIIW